MGREASTTAPDFEKKKKGLIYESTGRETGGELQICLSDPGFEVRF